MNHIDPVTPLDDLLAQIHPNIGTLRNKLQQGAEKTGSSFYNVLKIGSN